MKEAASFKDSSHREQAWYQNMMLGQLIEARKKVVREGRSEQDPALNVVCFNDKGEKIEFKGRMNAQGQIEEHKGPDPNDS